MAHNPGSPAAKSAGCKCPQAKNRNGEGAFTNQGGEVIYFLDKKCPLHGDDKHRRPDA